MNEKIEKAIEKVFDETNLWDGYLPSVEALAQAALTAIEQDYVLVPKDKVVVLEKGAEPEVGDVVRSHQGDTFYNVVENGLEILNAIIPHNARGMKIIQRQGKAAIEKEVE